MRRPSSTEEWGWYRRIMSACGRTTDAVRADGVDPSIAVFALLHAAAVLSVDTGDQGPEECEAVFLDAWADAVNANVDREIERAKATRTLGAEMVSIATGRKAAR